MRKTSNDIDRRVLLGVLGACACCLTPPPAALAQGAGGRQRIDVKGCRVPDQFSHLLTDRGLRLGATQGGAGGGEKLVRTTGNRDMDLALDAALYRLAQTFEIFPGFGFFDDADAPNAFAMSKALIPNTHGTVAFGHTYFKKWLSFDPTGVTVIATAAHEWAHVWLYRSGQYDRLLGGQPTVKRAELHADLLAGFYLGLRKKDHPDASLWAAGDKFRQIGDYETRSPDHHGTPAERVAAAERGFKMSFVEGKTARQAFEDGMQHVMRL